MKIFSELAPALFALPLLASISACSGDATSPKSRRSDGDAGDGGAGAGGASSSGGSFDAIGGAGGLGRESLGGLGSVPAANTPKSASFKPFAVTLQFEDGVWGGGSTVQANPTNPNPPATFDVRNFHGSGFVRTGAKGFATVTFKVPFGQTYEFALRHRATPGKGNKKNLLHIENASHIYDLLVEGTSSPHWQETNYVRRRLEPGVAKLTVITEGQWGYADLDEIAIEAVRVPPAPEVRRVPADPKATPETRRLLAFLADEYGKHVLAGQHDIAWTEDPAFDMLSIVEKETGKKPAVMGYDFMHMRWGRDYPGGKQDSEAIAFAKSGGISMISWHWMPGDTWGLYAGETTFRINRDPKSAAYKTLVSDIDKVAGWLKNLAKAKVPVLFRPLHEAVGGGFWWAANGAEDYVWLYRFLYARLVKHHGLHNILWMWNGGVDGVPADYYPGDDVVDLVGIDYGNSWSEPRLDLYAEASSLSSSKSWLAGFSEVDVFPNPSVLVRDGAYWSFVMHWYDDGNGKAWSTDPNKKKFYGHDFVLTFDELPDLATYPY